MAQPSTFPEWGDGATAVDTNPLSGTKQLGWVNAQRSPGQYLNWFFNLVYQWILWASGYARAMQWSFVPAVPENTVNIGGNFTTTSANQDATIVQVDWGIGSGGGQHAVRISPKVGDSITSIAAAGFASYTQTVLALVYADPTVNPNTGRTVIAATTPNGLPGTSFMTSARAIYTYALPTPHTVIQGASYWLIFYASGSSLQTAGITALGYLSGSP